MGTEALFDETLNRIKPQLIEFSNYDLVIGIPFFNEADSIGPLLQSIDRVLQSWIGRRQLIVCVGDASASLCLDVIKTTRLKHPHLEFLLPEAISGRGMAIRSIIEITKRLEADLLLFSANMANEQGPGIDNAWLESLLTPIQGEYDLVLGSLRRYLGMDSIAHMLAAPILEVFYGFRVGDPLGGIYALSHDFIEELAHEAHFWGDKIRGFGFDFWLITRALCWNRNVCEVSMGGVVHAHSLPTRNRIFSQTARAVFEAIKRDSATWLKDRLVIKVADILVRSEVKRPDIIEHSIPDLIHNFYQGCRDFSPVLERLSRAEEILRLAGNEQEVFCFSDDLWVSVVLDLVRMYAFDDSMNPASIIALTTALYNGKVASYLLGMHQFAVRIHASNEVEKDEVLVRKMESIRQNLTSSLWQNKAGFSEQWMQQQESARPALVPLGYMEYVPGKPIVVPKKICGRDACLVQTDNIFRDLRKDYYEKFNCFISEGLGLDPHAPPDQIIAGVEDFMAQLERGLEKLLPGDLHTDEGTGMFVQRLFQLFPQHRMFTVSSDLLREMLVRFPPINLMIPMGYYKPEQLIEKIGARDAFTQANMVETWTYTDRDLTWLVDNIKPENFEWVDIKPIILTDDLRMGLIAQGKISAFNLLTARISIKCLEPGQGGKYPRLRYFTGLVRRLAVAENFSRLFLLNAAERKNVGMKVRNSLLGLPKGEEFSAHTIIENHHHRKVVAKFKQIATDLEEQQNLDLARLFRLMAESYGLGQVLENGVFLTCTAWSWASYSFKGGLKIPTPLTTSVESRWFNHDFLEKLYQALGYNVEELMDLVLRLIQEGRSEQNLLDSLLPARPKDVTVIVQETTNEPSKYLKRYKGNPILEPLENHSWESKFVLNPGALRIGDLVYLFYRAVGEDGISSIGLAITDGYRVLERIPEPIFSPETPEEIQGCEDPRLIVIEDRIFMLYTAYDGNIAQIAAASIPLKHFQAGNYRDWQREGLAFKNIWDKDAIIFPERINGRYVIYHRIEPSIWVTYVDQLKFPIKEKHAIIIGPRPGRMWDSLKVGAGAQPIKTRYGWLLIYHGVDYNYVYRLGVILVDLNNPAKVIFRSPNPVLEPEEDYEVGLSGAWVPNVVFTCGAVAGVDKEILEDQDEILVYYGAADTSIGVARCTLADLIPEKFRKTDLK
ncbi:MAG TPA: glycosidase [Syntrophomonadaceae bacterium]|nr:glycosidase [Syntrophomonadaceae bacterium]